MKKLLFILSLFITSISYGQIPDTVFLKIKGGGGVSQHYVDSLFALGYTKAQVDSAIAANIGHGGGISKLGSPAYGLIRINDSTYILDTANTSAIYLKKTDTSVVNIIQQGAGQPMLRGSNDTIYSPNISGAGTVTVTKQPDSSILITGTGGTGTVTSVAKGYGILADGTITTTGTVTVDSAALSNVYPRRKDSTVSFTTPYQSSLKAGLSSTQTFTGSNTFQVPTFGAIAFQFVTATGLVAASFVNGNTDAAPVFQWNLTGGGILGGYLGDIRIIPYIGRSVLINTTTPISSALINAQSTTKGSLLTPMTTTQMNAISSPATGLQVTNITIGRTCTYDGSAWRYSPNVYTGTAAPTTTPLAVGDRFDDTTNKKAYEAMGTSSSSDWVILN